MMHPPFQMRAISPRFEPPLLAPWHLARMRFMPCAYDVTSWRRTMRRADVVDELLLVHLAESLGSRGDPLRRGRRSCSTPRRRLARPSRRRRSSGRRAKLAIVGDRRRRARRLAARSTSRCPSCRSCPESCPREGRRLCPTWSSSFARMSAEISMRNESSSAGVPLGEGGRRAPSLVSPPTVFKTSYASEMSCMSPYSMPLCTILTEVPGTARADVRDARAGVRLRGDAVTIPRWSYASTSPPGIIDGPFARPSSPPETPMPM